MKIAVTGGLGFIGKHISSDLLKAGNKVTVYARREEGLIPGLSFVRADLMIPGEWQNSLAENDVVINLAGVNIFQRWNEKIKKAILESRVITTANIVNSFKKGKTKGKTLINASAVGYYGTGSDGVMSELSPAGTDFLAEVCSLWEKEAVKGENKNMRVVRLRFGSVFGKEGGAFPLLKKNFRLMLAGRLGSGEQWFPWIHIDDVSGIILKAISDRKMSGPYNCTSPGLVTNGEFTKIMAKAVNRPVLVPFVPEIALKIILGEFGSFLTKGQKAVPEKLLKEKYQFRFPDLKGALDDLVKYY
jgi:uncharacterized protein (TIGR01777 family)